MNEPIPYVHRLRAELMAAAVRRRRATVRPVRAALVGAALAAVLAAGGMYLRDGEGPLVTERALAISRSADWITVRVVDAEANPQQMERELRAAGIPAEVDVVPVSPGMEGRWLSASGIALKVREDPGPHGKPFEDWIRPVGPNVDSPATIRISTRVAQARLEFGRRAQPGEAYVESQSAFLQGEALHCRGVERLTPKAAQKVVETLGYRVEWMKLEDRRPNRPGDWDTLIPVRHAPDGVLAGAQATSPHDMYLFVSNAPLDDQPPQHSFGHTTVLDGDNDPGTDTGAGDRTPLPSEIGLPSESCP